MASRLIILAGCAGSGKSTYVRRQFPEALVVSADHYFEELALRTGRGFEAVWDLRLLGTAHSLCQQRFSEALASGHPLIVVDNTNVRAADRQRFVKKGLEHGYEVEIHVLSPWRWNVAPPSPEEVADYVSLCHGRNVHGVPLDVIDQQFGKMDLPSGVYGVGKSSPFLRPLDQWSAMTGTTRNQKRSPGMPRNRATKANVTEKPSKELKPTLTPNPPFIIPKRPPADGWTEEALDAHGAAIVAALKRGLKKSGVK